MMKFRNLIRDYFTFNRSERIGLYVLIGLILIFSGINQVIFYFEKPGVVDVDEFNRLMDSLKLEEKTVVEAQAKNLFLFDPNQIDSLALDSLDIPSRLKRNLLKYREKGGRFRSKDDFKKIYGLTDSIFSAMEWCLQFPIDEKEVQVKQVVRNKKRTTERIEKAIPKKNTSFDNIELNNASVDELKSLYGIGDVLSHRIIKYRNLLGGFYSLNQLKEVYGLSEETYSYIAPRLRIDSSLIQKIDINFAEKADFAAHPYLKWRDAEAILTYRSKNGYINILDTLKEIENLNDSTFYRIKPYLRTISAN